MDDRGNVYGGAVFQEGFETGDKHRDILGDDRLIACDFDGGQSRPDNFTAMLTVTGVGARAEDGLHLAIVTAEVIEITFLDGFVEAVDGVEVC
jgi:hypothetical protein